MNNTSALELSAAIKEKKLSVTEAVESYIETIEKKDGEINAFIKVIKEDALAKAREVELRLKSGEILSPLAGVPIALSDNISTEETETTSASKMLKGYIPVFSATVVERLKQAGMIVIGKLNMNEFGIEGDDGTGIFGPVHNPLDTSLIIGSSSSGSAAAVAATEAPLSLGTDSGGGLRESSFCGVTAIKPSYGAVSRHGLIANASSMEQIGPVGKNINDCAALLSIISGRDGRDGTCILEKPFEFGEKKDRQLGGLRIGLQRNLPEGGTSAIGINDDVKKAITDAAREFESAGAIVEEFDMPLSEFIFPVWYIISSAELSSNLGRYDGLKFGYKSPNAKTLSETYRLSRGEGFGYEVKKRIMFGSLMLSSNCYDEYFRKALQARTLIKNEYEKLFSRFDILLSPAMPNTLGENKDALARLETLIAYNAAANLAGLPSVSLPCRFDGQPIGIQLTGKAFAEEKIINAARVYEGASA